MKTKEVKNGTSRLHVCNGQKLAKILVKKGLNAREFSTELGYHATYLPKVIRTNKIGETAVGLLLSKGIKPIQYDVDMDTTVKSKDPVMDKVIAMREKEENKCKHCALRDIETSGPSDCPTCRKCNTDTNKEEETVTGLNEKSPAELAMDEPGVVKVEFTLDIVKLKAIIKAAVKEAYEEL
jgi:hypothetical protein